jgi:hypothetical protein
MTWFLTIAPKSMFQVSISKLGKTETLEHGTLGKNRVIPDKNNQVLPNKSLANIKTPLKYN